MIPRHLIGCVAENVVQHDDYHCEAEFRCTCGSEVFSWYTVGAYLQTENGPRAAGIEVGGIPFFRVENECSACNAHREVFDTHYHGWNGFVCRKKAYVASPRPEMFLWNCPKCSSPLHTGRVGIASEGYADFQTMAVPGNGEFLPEDWVDAFGWIQIGLTCTLCGTLAPEWVSYETM